jgi:hypothetical protein
VIVKYSLEFLRSISFPYVSICRFIFQALPSILDLLCFRGLGVGAPLACMIMVCKQCSSKCLWETNVWIYENSEGQRERRGRWGCRGGSLAIETERWMGTSGM